MRNISNVTQITFSERYMKHISSPYITTKWVIVFDEIALSFDFSRSSYLTIYSTYDFKISTLAAHESQVSPYNLGVERSRSWGIGYCRWFRAIKFNVFHLWSWNFIHASQFVNDVPYWIWGEKVKIMTRRPVHKWLLVCYPLIIMKLQVTCSPWVFYWFWDQEVKVLDYWSLKMVSEPLKLTPCVKDIPCIFKVLKGFLRFLFFLHLWRHHYLFEIELSFWFLKVDSFFNSTPNALPKLNEYKVDSTPLHTQLHSTPRLHSMTPLRKIHGAPWFCQWTNPLLSNIQIRHRGTWQIPHISQYGILRNSACVTDLYERMSDLN